MSILVEKLKTIVEDLKRQNLSGNVINNGLKEYLQYAVLNYIYNSKEYSGLTMYGGSLLRICYGLDRMSVDLDFQYPEKIDLEKLKSEIAVYFEKELDYIDLNISIKGKETKDTNTLVLSFMDLLKNLDVDIQFTALKLSFDINLFPSVVKFIPDFHPVAKDDFTFSIRTYALPTLMASKIAAVLLRTERGIGTEKYNSKGRDVYDLLWYMRRKIMPDIEFIREKGIEVADLIELFDMIDQRMYNIDERALTLDLNGLFYSDTEMNSWIQNWRNQYKNLRSQYEIFRVGNLMEINFFVKPSNEVRYVRFFYQTEEKDSFIEFEFRISNYFFTFKNVQIDEVYINPGLDKYLRLQEGKSISELDKNYIGMFYEKIEKFLSRTKRIVTQREFKSKSIRITADKFDSNTEVIQDKKLLMRSKLENLL